MSSQPKPITWEWLSAFFDGEGCIVVRRDKRAKGVAIWLQFHQHSRSGVLMEIREFLELRGIGTYYRDAGAHSSIQVHVKSDVHKCLKRMLPYLHVKREHALVCEEFLTDLTKLQKEFGMKYWTWTGYRLIAPKTATGKETSLS